MFCAFAKLGMTSFGGPIAHLGYFRDELVIRRRWIDEAGYADLVALCQFLPGPASSQVGYTLGLVRGGPLGGLAAWFAFTLPSAVLLVLFAFGAASFGGSIAAGLIHGLKIVAVAIVAQAVWGMARTLTPDKERASIALVAAVLVSLLPGAVGQIGAIAIGGVAGVRLCRADVATMRGQLSLPISKAVGLLALLLFLLLLAGLPALSFATGDHGVALFEAFYRSGALVFGGGHVVLPLLDNAVVRAGWIDSDGFLAGYGAAQAVPGPLFAFAAYLGAAMEPWPQGWLGATICLVAIFLPGLLLVTGTLPFWTMFRARPLALAVMRGTNAAVVGILAAALYDPVWTSAIVNPSDAATALLGFALLTVWSAPPWLIVLLSAGAGLALGPP